MGKEISWEIRVSAEELYIIDGLTFERVSAATGVSISQLKRWAKESNWRDQRQEHRQALSDIKRNSVKLRTKLIKKAISTLDPQAVYAAARFESVAANIIERPYGAGEELSAKVFKNIKTPEDAITALQEVIERKINIMLTRPDGISLTKIKEMKQALELIENMKSKYSIDVKDTTKKKKQLDQETLKIIREEVYGL